MAAAYKAFIDLDGDFINDQVLFRLIHFWESRNFMKENIFMGLELLLIDEKSTVVQGFISKNQIANFESTLKPNSVYKMNNFSLIKPKLLYKVSDYKHTICFTDQTILAEVETEGHDIPSQHFRFREFNDFAAVVDRHDNLYDVIGHIRVIDGDNIQFPVTNDGAPLLQEEILNAHVTLHLQMKDGTTVRVKLWDKIAATFRKKLNKSVTKPTVMLVTTVNPKRYQGAISLNSTSSTRVFIDNDIDVTSQYMKWLGEAGKTTVPVIKSSKVAKLETATIGEIKKYIGNNTGQEVM